MGSGGGGGEGGDSRRIFSVMLHLYGTQDMGENNFRACEEVQQDGGFRR